MKGLWRLGTRPELARLAAPVAGGRGYSCGTVPVPITTLTDEEQMMKETGVLSVVLVRYVYVYA